MEVCIRQWKITEVCFRQWKIMEVCFRQWKIMEVCFRQWNFTAENGGSVLDSECLLLVGSGSFRLLFLLPLLSLIPPTSSLFLRLLFPPLPSFFFCSPLLSPFFFLRLLLLRLLLLVFSLLFLFLLLLLPSPPPPFLSCSSVFLFFLNIQGHFCMIVFSTRSGVLRTQKLRSALLRTRS